MASIAVLLTWYKIFYWMKLFNTPAFFIDLLSETMADQKFRAFCIMMIVMILMFTNVFYIMNQERGGEFKYSEDSYDFNEELYTKDLPGDLGFINSMIYMYKLTLGDFTTKTY